MMTIKNLFIPLWDEKVITLSVVPPGFRVSNVQVGKTRSSDR